jgi:hypothetical protein
VRLVTAARGRLCHDSGVPSLACRTCGRVVYATVPLDQLFAEERGCPRCGALLADDRRSGTRRGSIRRWNPPDDPGPTFGVERRMSDRRLAQRRADDARTLVGI